MKAHKEAPILSTVREMASKASSFVQIPPHKGAIFVRPIEPGVNKNPERHAPTAGLQSKTGEVQGIYTAQLPLVVEGTDLSQNGLPVRAYFDSLGNQGVAVNNQGEKVPAQVFTDAGMQVVFRDSSGGEHIISKNSKKPQKLASS